MEESQIQYIIENGIKLMELIAYTELLDKSLVKQGALLITESDDLLGRVLLPSEKVGKMLRKMRAVENGYNILLKALQDSNQTGAVALLKKFYKGQGSHTHPAQGENDQVPGQSSPSHEAAVKDMMDFYQNGDKATTGDLKVVVEKPNYDMQKQFKNPYNLPTQGKGLALIINVKIFEDPAWKREGSEHDARYMRDLWKQLGYKIFREDQIDLVDWKKETISCHLKAFMEECTSTEPASVVVFIGSHGEHNKIYSSDKKTLFLYEDIVSKFYDSNCPVLKQKPKLFLVNACQVFGEPHQTDKKPIEVPVTNLVVCTAQAPGFSSYRYPTSGSWFAHGLAYVFMKYAREKSLIEMLNIVSEFFRNIKSDKTVFNEENKEVPLAHGQIPEIRRIGMNEPLYFFLDQE